MKYRILFLILFFSSYLFPMERYDISKNYPGGSKVIYNDQVYEAKWWANPGQTPAQKVEHEWDTPWKKIDSSIKAESEIPTPVISKPVVPKPEKMETKVEPTRIREALAPWPKKVFAPYTDSTLYPILKLSDIARATGVKYFILGFVVSKDGCNLSWGTYYDIEKGPSSWVESGEYYLYDELNKIRDLGGDFMVSIGGAINKPLAATCTNVDELVGKYHYLIDTLKLKALDFDIEGHWVEDQESIERRSRALFRVQENLKKKRQDVKIWYTLPVLPSGLTASGIKVIESALTHKVELAGVNIMAMDYGDSAAPSPEGQMGDYAIKAAESLSKQLKQIYQKFGKNLSEAQVWSMIGITPMIGLNDITTEKFRLKDAQKVLEFAKSKNIGLIGMWSVNRDNPCPEKKNVDNKCSSIEDQTKPNQFMEIFKEFK